eukprot:GHRR01031533.1.p1 GENE.GHRR01031533.1~~GHRR01031533.1.p1  ORF type:complete len:152 (-),score=34.88 GHRR01031533.1:413-868(-)
MTSQLSHTAALLSSARCQAEPHITQLGPGGLPECLISTIQALLRLGGDCLTYRRKSRQVEAQLKELGLEALEERLSSATQNPAQPSYRLSRMVTEVTQMQVWVCFILCNIPWLVAAKALALVAVGSMQPWGADGQQLASAPKPLLYPFYNT